MKAQESSKGKLSDSSGRRAKEEQEKLKETLKIEEKKQPWKSAVQCSRRTLEESAMTPSRS